MKNLNLIALAFTVLASQTGCIGPKPKDAELPPYATAEIQEKLAKRINPELQTVPKDYFETLDYSHLLTKILQDAESGVQQPLQLLGDTPETQAFWYCILRMRALTMYFTYPRAIDDPGIMVELLNDLGTPVEEFFETNPQKAQEILSAVLRYDEKYPYTPLKQAEKNQKLTKEDIAKRFGISSEDMAKISDEDVEKFKQQEHKKILDFPKETFNKTYAQMRQIFSDDLERIKSGKSLEEWMKMKKADMGVAEYTVHFVGPVLYPAEMMFAEFALSPTDEKAVYSYPAVFFTNQAPSSLNSSRLENEKPLPYKLDLMWYSITENKVYSLETELPRETLKAKILGGAGKWDALLFTLEPYGKVTLYAFNQTNNEKEKLASFEAKTEDAPFERFQQVFGEYDNRETPAKNWDEYRQYALANFPEAAENLKKNGRPVAGPDINYWEENPENIFEGLPDAQDINTPDKDGFTPLMNAIRKNAGNTVSTLIKEGADVNYQAPSGETALGLAVDGNFVLFTKELIAAGADVNAKHVMNGQETGLTPLKIAQDGGHTEIAAMLAAAGAH